MSENPLSKIEKLHIGVQILAQATTIIAAIVVGMWGYYSTVYVKKEQQITDYTLKELDQKTIQKPHIQAKVESTVESLIDGQHMLQIKVTISNFGNIESKVDFDDNALTLIPVVFSEGKPAYRKPVNLITGRYAGTLNRAPLDFVNVGAGETYEFTFVHTLETPGIYLIHFLALNGTAPTAEETRIMGGLPHKYSIGADQYVVVK